MRTIWLFPNTLLRACVEPIRAALRITMLGLGKTARCQFSRREMHRAKVTYPDIHRCFLFHFCFEINAVRLEGPVWISKSLDDLEAYRKSRLWHILRSHFKVRPAASKSALAVLFTLFSYFHPFPTTHISLCQSLFPRAPILL